MASQNDRAINLTKKQKKLIGGIFISILAFGVMLFLYDILSGVFYKAQLSAEKNTIEYVDNKYIQENLLNEVDKDGYFLQNVSINDLENLKVLPLSPPSLTEYDILGGLLAFDTNISMPIVSSNVKNPYNVGAVFVGEEGQAKFGEGNLVLGSSFGNKNNILFTNLINTELGETFIVTDKDRVYNYEVKDKLIVSKERKDLYQLKAGKPLLTLVTPYSDTEMLVVVCEFINSEVYAGDLYESNFGY